MQRVSTSSAVATLPTPPAGGTPGFFAKPDPVNSVSATSPGYAWYNAVQEELMAVIEGQGFAGNASDNTLLRKAITKMIQAGQRSVVINNVIFAPTVINQGAAVYWDSANNRFDLALADGSQKQNVVGFADIPGGNLYCFGDAVLFSNLTPGSRYFLSGTTPGAIVVTSPANTVSIGIAKSSSELFVDIDSSANGVSANQIQQFSFNSATAGGTADAITASFSPAISQSVLSQGTVTLTVWPTAANASTKPNFTPNPGTIDPWPIVKGNSQALGIGDIAGTGHPITLQANFAAKQWVLLNPATGISGMSAVQGAYKNLQMSTPGTNSKVYVSADEIVLESAGGAYATARAVNLTIDSAVAGLNGVDTGAALASTHYAVWVIAKPDGTVGGLLSLSLNTPVLPAGYTLKARVGRVRLDGNKYPLSIIKANRRVQLKVAAGTNVPSTVVVQSGPTGNISTQAWTEVDLSGYVPDTATSVFLSVSQTTANQLTMVAPNANYGTSLGNPPPLVSASGGSGGAWTPQYGSIMIEKPQKIYVVSNASPGNVALFGWEEDV